MSRPNRLRRARRESRESRRGGRRSPLAERRAALQTPEDRSALPPGLPDGLLNIPEDGLETQAAGAKRQPRIA
jgi:hypothetical protein